jgi:hypothetical protein
MVVVDSDCNYSCHLTCKDLVNLDCSEKPEESDDTSASDAVTEAVDFTDSEVCTPSQHISHSANTVYYKFCVLSVCVAECSCQPHGEQHCVRQCFLRRDALAGSRGLRTPQVTAGRVQRHIGLPRTRNDSGQCKLYYFQFS